MNLNLFFRYVSASVAGMIALSCYILADTYFVSAGMGADGLTALNLAIPIYSFIHGSGLMIGIGAATRFTMQKSRGQDREAHACSRWSVWQDRLAQNRSCASSAPREGWRSTALTICG